MAIRLQVFWFECLLRENGLAIMTRTTFKVSTAALHLLAIACIMLVVVQVTEAARELDDGVGGVLVNGAQVASVHTKAGLTVFQAAACELLRCPVPSSLLTMTALQLVLCAWRRGNAAVECAFAIHLPVGAVDEVAEPQNIVKISESENPGFWSSCVDASVFEANKVDSVSKIKQTPHLFWLLSWIVDKKMDLVKI